MIKKNYTLSFDWIQFTTLGLLPLYSETTRINESLYINPLGHGNKQFREIHELIYMGQKVAVIQSHPRSDKVLNPNLNVIKMANDVCYETGISELIKILMRALHQQFNNWTRLDIALDGHNLLDPLVNAAMEKEVRTVSRADISFRRSGCKKGYIKALQIGSKVSDKSLVGYNKTHEMKKSQKHYIREFWERNKLDTTKDVERLEIRMKSQELKRYKIFDPQRESDPISVIDRLINNPGMFETLFLSASKRLYEFVDLEAKHTDKAERKYPLQLFNVGTKLMKKASRLARSELARMKQTSKTLYFIGRATGLKFYEQLSKDVANMIDHSKWRVEKKKHWARDYRIREGDKRFDFLSFLTDNPHFEQLRLWEIPNISDPPPT